MNLNERVKSLFGDTSIKHDFTYVDGINCIQLTNFGGFDRLYINYMEKLGQPMGFTVDGYSKFFQRFMNASLEITVLVDKHAEEFEIVKQFFNAVTSIDVTNPCRCKICTRSRKIEKIIKTGTIDELRRALESVFESLMNVENDLDWELDNEKY